MRRFLVLCLALALPLGTGCTSGELPLGTQIETDGSAVGDGAVPPLDADLLLCEPQPYATATMVIGPSGGQVSVGYHSLKIFENALSEEVAITVEQIEGRVNSVRFSPEGLHFAIPAVLTLSYKNCANVRHSKRIVYTDESLNILQSLPSLDFNRSSQVKTLIHHFSRYAVGY